MEDKLKLSFGNYFNNILRESLKYEDNFDVKVDLDSRQITLTSYGNSQLIQMLITDKKLKDKLESELLYAFQKNNPNVGYIEMRIINQNEITIEWGFSIKSFQDLEYFSNLALNLTVNELKNLCVLNRDLERICKDKNFWIRLFNNKFGEIPDYVPKDINYRKFYIDILSFIEFKEKWKKSIDFMDQHDVKQYYNLDLMNIFNNLNNNSIYYLLEHDEYVSIDALMKTNIIYNPQIMKLVLSKYKFSNGDIVLILTDILNKIFSKKNYSDNFPISLDILLNYFHNAISKVGQDGMSRLIYHAIDGVIRTGSINDLFLNENVLDLLENYIKRFNSNFDLKEFIRSHFWAYHINI